MKAGAVRLALWAVLVALAALVVTRARYSADLSAFLPRTPDATQRLLIEQITEGVASRLILIGIEGGDAGSRAAVSRALARRLAHAGLFVSVRNGRTSALDRDRQFLFAHRYQLSPAVNAARFTAAGLRAAIDQTVAMVNSPVGLLARPLLRDDPTGELLQVLNALGRGAGQPHTRDGVWSSADGSLALLVAQTRAAGSDTDGQQRAIAAIHGAFATSLAGLSPSSLPRMQLLLSGPGVFAVHARSTIEREAVGLSLLSTALIVALLLWVYRSLPTLLLGLMPVVSGALAGVAAVALGFGVVQGVTLGFGITLIGESVDYSIYLFIQSSHRAAVPASLWPTITLGAATSICGFASLLPSEFPGLQQLGAYSIAGLLAAVAVTRLVLPGVLPRRLAWRDLSPLGAALDAALRRVRAWIRPAWLLGLALACAGVLYVGRSHLWDHDLADLSPISPAAIALDQRLRQGLGAPDVSNLVIVDGADLQAVLRRAERVGARLDRLVGEHVIGGYQSAARYLPSRATQIRRIESLPTAKQLRARLRGLAPELPIRVSALNPFIRQVAAARRESAIGLTQLQGTALGLAAEALLWQSGRHWYGLMPLEAPSRGGHAGSIDLARVRDAVSGAAPGHVLALNLRQQTDDLYASYLSEATRLSLGGLLAIVVLLALVLRSAARVARVMVPLLLAVMTVAAALRLAGVQLTILHLVGMLLIVAVGSNYALFFDRRTRDASLQAVTLVSLVVANVCTAIGFGVLALSSVPVLHQLGQTVAPGAVLALLFSALLAPSLSMSSTRPEPAAS